MNKDISNVKQSPLHNFDERNTVFNRVFWDKTWSGYKKKIDEEALKIIGKKKKGYSRADFSLAYASWVVHNTFKEGFPRKNRKNDRKNTDHVRINWKKIKPIIYDSNKMSAIIKKAAKLFGVSLVGVCKLNNKWLYKDVDISDKFKNVIVMAVEMDFDGISTSPAVPASVATAMGYSKMSFILTGMGEFIRNLGYGAIECGNDTALSIPLAVDAGLGELGRNGLLITPKYGPRVRLCKIITDLPLKKDKQLEFGVKKFCKKCKLCALNCEVNAISMDDEPSFEAKSISNNSGALKWYVNAEKCYLFWCKNGTDCSNCIKTCPYNRINKN